MDSVLAWGTVGWLTDNETTFYDLGDGSGRESQTNLTIVRVTLFQGRDPTVSIDQTRAQGREIVCQLGSQFFCIPPLTTRVLVALPEPHGTHPAIGTILQAVDDRSAQIYGTNYTPGDLVFACLTSLAQMALKGDKSITLTNALGTIEIDPNGNVLLTQAAGGQVILAGGGPAIARVGDTVTITQAQLTAAGATVVISPGPPPVTSPVTITAPLECTITSGSENAQSG